MNWEAVGAFGEVVGALAVVVTLVYLARQIRGSAAANHVMAYHQAQQQLWSAAETAANDPTLSELVANTIGGGIDTLSPVLSQILGKSNEQYSPGTTTLWRQVRKIAPKQAMNSCPGFSSASATIQSLPKWHAPTGTI